MNRFFCYRALYPASLDLNAFSCTSRLKERFLCIRQFCRSAVVFNSESGSKPNENYEVNPTFVNRNPRNLESLGYAYKRRGWTFQSPNKNYYNKLVIKIKSSDITAHIVHWTGRTVVSASTSEMPIKKFLYSSKDYCAAENLGRILGNRCLQVGLTHVFFDLKENLVLNSKMKAFLETFKENVILEEPEEIEPPLSQRFGIDYDKPNRLAEKRKYKNDYQVA